MPLDIRQYEIVQPTDIEASILSSVCAVIVLYYPDLEVLDRLIASTQNQVGMICFIDNTPCFLEEFGRFESNSGARTIHIRLGDNLGLAAAQNVGIRKAREAGFSHVLMLDQDSELTPQMVEGLLSAERDLLAKSINVAAVGPMSVDIKTGRTAPAHRYLPFHLQQIRVPEGSPPLETDWLIASGSLTRCSVFDQVGPMREELFIDSVDTEWGMRAKNMGLRSFILPAVPMKHSVGDSAKPFLGRSVIQHNQVRSYYIARNYAYLMRVKHMGWRYRSNAPLTLFLYALVHIWLSPDRLIRARVILRAMYDGICGKTGRFR